jgi:hypothetical protein
MTTANAQGAGDIGKVRTARRRILAGVGAGALATSVGLFGSKGKPAMAAPLCCDLANYPANTSYSYCRAHASYIWYCSATGSLHCACCETAGNRKSAASCSYN